MIGKVVSTILASRWVIPVLLTGWILSGDLSDLAAYRHRYATSPSDSATVQLSVVWLRVLNTPAAFALLCVAWSVARRMRLLNKYPLRSQIILYLMLFAWVCENRLVEYLPWHPRW